MSEAMGILNAPRDIALDSIDIATEIVIYKKPIYLDWRVLSHQ